MKLLLRGTFILATMFSFSSLYAQEFPKGGVLYLEALQGASTRFNKQPDLYVANFQLSPQLTLIPGRLRLAGTGGLLFHQKNIFGTYGGGLNWKLAAINIDPFGSLFNVQLQLQQLFGTGGQKLVGGGIKAELGQIALAGVSVHRDYARNNWWLQAGIGYNLLRRKRNKPADPFDQR